MCPVFAKSLVASLLTGTLGIYPVSSISSRLYWNSNKVGERGGSERGREENERVQSRQEVTCTVALWAVI